MGVLFIVSTPIGNLEDFSQRAKKTLDSVDYVLCEETSQTKKLLNSQPQKEYPFVAKLLRYEGKGFKGELQQAKVIADLNSGKNIALVTNAGTPLISDPGQSLVNAVVKSGLPVIHIPGPVAMISAVITSGLPTKNLIFIGFLSKKEVAIRKDLEKAKKAMLALEEPASIVLYCSKYQLFKTLSSIKLAFGEKTLISIAGELTKLHEKHFTGTVSLAEEWLKSDPLNQKGEFTIVIGSSVIAKPSGSEAVAI